MSITRSRANLLKAESLYNNKKYFKALILALIGIGWMIDDITSAYTQADYKEVDWMIDLAEIAKSEKNEKNF